MQTKTRQGITWFISWLLLIISFSIIGFLLVTKAMGYRYNSHINRWQKTGMLVISTNPRESYLEFDNTTVNINKLTRVPNVLPGTYRLSITKNGYLPWRRAVTIDPGLVTNFSDVQLFYSEPTERPATTREIEQFTTNLPSNQIQLIDGELRFGADLVTRFVNPPTTADLLPTRRHIVYLRNDELRVIEINGQNDQLVYRRLSAEPTKVYSTGDGTVLLSDEGIVKALTLY
jgi:hypothetical protein